MPDLHTAQSVRFRVKIDGGNDLGEWAKCDGHSVEYDVSENNEGRKNSFTHRIPRRVKYQTIKLTRPINTDSKQVADWIAGLKRQVRRQTGEISALDPEGQAIVTWDLEGIYPVRWSGPSLDIGNNQVATETLELAHNGFLGG